MPLADRRPWLRRQLAGAAAVALLASILVAAMPAPAWAVVPTISTGAAQSAAENQTSVVDIDATDPEGDTEGGGGLTYSIVGGADAAAFSIDTNSGVLTFVSAPDFENPTDLGGTSGDNVYEVTVEVEDSEPLTDSVTFSVTVTNVNDNAPTITSGGGGPTAGASADENQTSATDVDSSDLDGSTEGGGGLTYSITGGADMSLFGIDTHSGMLTFNSPPDFEHPLDQGINNTYRVEVTVSDGTFSDMQDITVTVDDVNDAPVISTGAAQSVVENQAAVVDVDASDPEGDIEGAGLSYAITGGADLAAFSIVTDSGVLTFGSAPDFENPTDLGGTPGDNVYEVEVTVTDSGLLTDVVTFSVTVDDVNDPPTVTPDTFTIPVTASIGSLVGTVTASDVDAGHSVVGMAIIAGDPAEIFAISASGSLTVVKKSLLAVGSTVLTVRAFDTLGLFGDGTITVNIVASSPPAPNPIGDATGVEATPVSLNATFTDPDDGDTHTATIDWGDGTPVEAGTVDQLTDTISGSHTYADDGSFTAMVVVTDETGLDGSVSFQIDVANVAPAVTPPAKAAAVEGRAFLLSGVPFSEPGLADTFSATIDFGDGGGAQPATVLQASGAGFVSGSHSYGEDGIFAATVCVTDDDGGTGCGNVTVTVTNAAPVVTPPEPVSGFLEAATASIGGATFTDAGAADTHTATIDWGDGSPPERATINGTISFGTHVYADSGAFTVTVCVTDDDGGVGCSDTTMTIVNVDPAFMALAIKDAAGNDTINFEVGDEVFFTGSFTDPGADTHTVEVDWGDGITTTTPVPAGSRNFAASHVYASTPTSGTFFTAQVILRDDDFGAAAVAGPVVVASPAAQRDTAGLFDPGQGQWHLFDASGSPTSFFFGNPGDVPFTGDWDCDGIATPGLYRQSDGLVYLNDVNASGVATRRFFFGNPGDVPLAGDFNDDGCDTVSIYRPSEQRIYVINTLGQNNQGLGAADTAYTFGNPGDKPFVGDFDGNGVDEVGLHRVSTGLVYFRLSHTPGAADAEFVFGDPEDRIVAGDWIGQGFDTPALFRPSLARLFFRHSNSAGAADAEFDFGDSTFIPLSGKFGLL